MPDIAYRTVAWIYPASGAAFTCPVELLFSREDPYAVSLLFGPGIKDTVCWTFGRDLLNAAASSSLEIGGGDVTFMRLTSGRIMGSLDSPYGKSKFSLPLDSVECFLLATECAVPYGEEPAAYEAAIDKALAELLGSE